MKDKSKMHVDRVITNDSIITEHKQDVTEVLKFAHHQRVEQTNCKANMHHVARIPLSLIQKLINEGRVHKDVLADKEEFKKAVVIISEEYPAFMCTDKKVL